MSNVSEALARVNSHQTPQDTLRGEGFSVRISHGLSHTKELTHGRSLIYAGAVGGFLEINQLSANTRGFIQGTTLICAMNVAIALVRSHTSLNPRGCILGVWTRL